MQSQYPSWVANSFELRRITRRAIQASPLFRLSLSLALSHFDGRGPWFALRGTSIWCPPGSAQTTALPFVATSVAVSPQSRSRSALCLKAPSAAMVRSEPQARFGSRHRYPQPQRLLPVRAKIQREEYQLEIAVRPQRRPVDQNSQT